MDSLTPPLRRLLPALALASTACVADGGSITATASDGSDDGGADDTNDDNDDNDDSATTSPNDGGDDDDGSEDDGEDPAQCDEYIGDTAGDPVDITIVNTSAQTIYLDWYFGLPPLSLVAPGVDWGWVGFGTPCANIVSVGADSFCGEGIPIPQTLRIDAGQQYTYAWSGQLFEYQPIPLDCVHPDDADEWPCDLIETCGIRHAPPPGTYAAMLSAYPDLDNSGAPSMECEGDPCIFEHAFVVGDAMEASIEFEYPTDAVTLVF